MQLPYRGRCDETFNQSEVGNDKRQGVRNARKNKSFGVWSKNLTTILLIIKIEKHLSATKFLSLLDMETAQRL